MRAVLRGVPHPAYWSRYVADAVFKRPALRELVFRYADWRDARHARQGDFAALPLPPARLRFRVHGDLDALSFLETGRQCSQDLTDAIARIGKDLSSFRQVLDFGCGCGRTLLWLRDTATSTCVYGTDIDADAIAWCQRRIGFARFFVNNPSPPLVFPDESFDLVYVFSVFTHLDEKHQLEWLKELQRVTRRGGNVIITVRGSFQQAKMSAQELSKLSKSGFLCSQMPNKAMHGIFPEWYQMATHTREYIQTEFTRYFNFLDYVPTGLDHSQDVVILQRP
jgi:ubiquinone/menaquinone biosynthesis C-methylase UbiE